LIPGSGRSPGEGIGYPVQCSWVSLVAQLVKNPPTVQETRVQSMAWERLPTPVFWPEEFNLFTIKIIINMDLPVIMFFIVWGCLM